MQVCVNIISSLWYCCRCKHASRQLRACVQAACTTATAHLAYPKCCCAPYSGRPVAQLSRGRRLWRTEVSDLQLRLITAMQQS